MSQNSSMTKMLTVLTAVCLLSGAILAAIHSVTAKPMAEAAQKARVEAIAQVLPQFTNNPIADAVEITVEGDSRPFTVYPAMKDGKFVGAAVDGYSLDGFSGEITAIYGFDAKGKVTGYHVMSHSETPGLGAKMEEWFRMAEGQRSVIGLDPSEKDMRVSKDGGDIDAITAATISSRAFLGALRGAYKAFETYKNQNMSNQ